MTIRQSRRKLDQRRYHNAHAPYAPTIAAASKSGPSALQLTIIVVLLFAFLFGMLWLDVAVTG